MGGSYDGLSQEGCMAEKLLARFGLALFGFAILLALALAGSQAVNSIGMFGTIAYAIGWVCLVVGLLTGIWAMWFGLRGGANPEKRLEHVRQEGERIHDELTAPNDWTAFLTVKNAGPIIKRAEKWRRRAEKCVPPKDTKAWEQIWDAILATTILGTQPKDLAARERAELEWQMGRALQFVEALQKGEDPTPQTYLLHPSARKPSVIAPTHSDTNNRPEPLDNRVRLQGLGMTYVTGLRKMRLGASGGLRDGSKAARLTADARAWLVETDQILPTRSAGLVLATRLARVHDHVPAPPPVWRQQLIDDVEDRLVLLNSLVPPAARS
jgi:hypothetical protein